jgi:hypothetical protein
MSSKTDKVSTIRSNRHSIRVENQAQGNHQVTNNGLCLNFDGETTVIEADRLDVGVVGDHYESAPRRALSRDHHNQYYPENIASCDDDDADAKTNPSP